MNHGELETVGSRGGDAPPFDDRYRLVRPLAKVTSGGYVYAAEHVLTRKPCAVKLFDRRAPESVRKRVRREMDSLALAQGDGVVSFLDAGEAEGHLYMVFELLPGRTLASLLAAKGRLDIGVALRFAADIAGILASCHDRGVVHRDVKPANVFVTPEDEVRLLDFGIAKLLDPEHKLEVVTQENSILGTPEYMSPEALLASPGLDPRADQYSLAIVLYECLTSVVPFEGAYGEVLRKVTSTTMRPVRELRPEVPQAVADVLGRALAKDPAGRYATTYELQAALRSALAALVERRGAPDARSSGLRNSETMADVPLAKARAGLSRRAHPRASYMTFAQVRRTNTDAFDGRIEEISLSGCQLVAQRGVPEGEVVTLRFTLPISGRVVDATATARWTRTSRALHATGFSFGTLPPDAAADIDKYVSLMTRGDG